MIKKRIDDAIAELPEKSPDAYWTKHLAKALDWYNNKHAQRTTNVTPTEATKPENEFDVKTNLEINATHRRKYPEIEVGDIVRSYRKKKVGEKERHGNFEEGTKKVKAITESLGQKFYKLDNEQQEYIRADLHLIRKGPGKKLPEDLRHLESFEEEDANADVEARRKIDLDEGQRTEEIDPEEELKKLKRMNKKDRAKYLAKKEPKPGPEKGPDLSGALGGRASGSGMFGRPI
jgi:hypothetical protein